MSTSEGGSNIIQNGLVLCFDPANTKCFVSGSTTASDLGKNSTLMTFKNKVYSGGGTLDIVTVISPQYNTDNGGSVFFSGVSVLSGDAAYLPSGDTTTNFSGNVTMSVWFKKSSYNYSYVECPVAKGYGGGSITQPYTFYLLNDSIYARLTTSTTNGYTDISSQYSINVWNNAVLTYDGTTFSLYINGVLKASTAKSGPIMNTTQPFNIGCQNNAGYFPSTAPSKTSEYFNGNISSVLLYDTALTSSEVLQNYNALKSRFGL